jgi:small redox-active disulfide protein 2
VLTYSRWRRLLMIIQIYGTGCTKCNLLEKEVKKAVEKNGIDAQVEKIEDVDKMIDLGIMITPALAIDGVVKSAGKVLSEDDILRIIRGEK